MLNLSKNEKEDKQLRNFQNTVLNLNFFKIIDEEAEDLQLDIETSDLVKIDPKKKWKINFNDKKYKTIPLQFENEQKYINSFKNIFFLELQANLVTIYTKQKKKKKTKFNL